jgi:hypothetical protein
VDDLVAMFEEGDAFLCPVMAWEISRRLPEIKTTLFAFRYLLPRDDAERTDAWSGLVGRSFNPSSAS